LNIGLAHSSSFYLETDRDIETDYSLSPTTKALLYGHHYVSPSSEELVSSLRSSSGWASTMDMLASPLSLEGTATVSSLRPVYHSAAEVFVPDTIGQSQIEILQIIVLKLWWMDYDAGYRFNQHSQEAKVGLIARLVNVNDGSDDHRGGFGRLSTDSINAVSGGLLGGGGDGGDAVVVGDGPFVRLVDAMPFLHMLFVHSPNEMRVQWCCATRVRTLVQRDGNACRNLFKDERWTHWLVEMLLISGDNISITEPPPPPSEAKTASDDSAVLSRQSSTSNASSACADGAPPQPQENNVFEVICVIFADLLIRAVYQIGAVHMVDEAAVGGGDGGGVGGLAAMNGSHSSKTTGGGGRSGKQTDHHSKVHGVAGGGGGGGGGSDPHDLDDKWCVDIFP
jgi:hypothetical protein